MGKGERRRGGRSRSRARRTKRVTRARKSRQRRHIGRTRHRNARRGVFHFRRRTGEHARRGGFFSFGFGRGSRGTASNDVPSAAGSQLGSQIIEEFDDDGCEGCDCEFENAQNFSFFCLILGCIIIAPGVIMLAYGSMSPAHEHLVTPGAALVGVGGFLVVVGALLCLCLYQSYLDGVKEDGEEEAPPQSGSQVVLPEAAPNSTVISMDNPQPVTMTAGMTPTYMTGSQTNLGSQILPTYPEPQYPLPNEPYYGGDTTNGPLAPPPSYDEVAMTTRSVLLSRPSSM